MKRLSEIQHLPLLTNRRKIWAGAIVLLSLVAFVLFTRGPEAPTPNPPGTFTFAVLGMEVLWAKLGQTVIEVEERLRKKREIAHTTVLTTMDPLYRKGSPDTLR